MDLRAFLVALVADWISLSSGIASIILTVLAVIRRWEKIPVPALWGTAAVCFLLAAARIWTTEHRRAEQLSRTIDQLSKPSLEGKIGQLGISPVAFPSEVRVVAVLLIRNTGTDSYIDGWDLRADLPDGRRVHAAKRHAMVGEQQVLPWGDKELVYSPEDSIFTKLPLKRGDQIAGVISFGFSGIPFDTLAQAGTRFVVSFRDVIGTSYSTPAWSSQGVPVEPLYFPGTHPTLRKKGHQH